MCKIRVPFAVPLSLIQVAADDRSKHPAAGLEWKRQSLSEQLSGRIIMLCSASGYQLKQVLQRCYFPEDWSYRPIQTRADMGDFLEEISKTLGTLGFSHRDVMAVRLALEEAVVNAIRHGHREDPKKRVHVRFHVTQHLVLVEVQDEGKGFEPDVVADPTTEANQSKECGRGLFLMRHYMTWVEFSENGTCVTLCKHRAPGGAGPQPG